MFMYEYAPVAAARLSHYSFLLWKKESITPPRPPPWPPPFMMDKSIVFHPGKMKVRLWPIYSSCTQIMLTRRELLFDYRGRGERDKLEYFLVLWNTSLRNALYVEYKSWKKAFSSAVNFLLLWPKKGGKGVSISRNLDLNQIPDLTQCSPRITV